MMKNMNPSTNSGSKNTTSVSAPIKVVATTFAVDTRALGAVVSRKDWTRYADSRLKQFCCR
jgi:hypothetical protein